MRGLSASIFILRKEMGWGVGRTGYWYRQLLKKFVGSVGMGSVKFETSAALWVASPSDAKILNVSNSMC